MSSITSAMPKYESYKDSGLAWLGDIPTHWFTKPMCAVASIVSISNVQDKELLSVYLYEGVIRFSDVDEKRTNATSQDLSKYQLVSPGDFVLNNQQAWRGSVGVSSYEGIVSPAYLVLKMSGDFDAGFANYLFRDGIMVSQYLVCSKGVGTIQRNLYWPQLKRSVVFYPPLKEQTSIAAFLDRKTAQINQAVKIKERQIELLKERKQIIIQNAVTRGLNPDAPMRDSGVEWIGQIPESWATTFARYCFRVVKRYDRDGTEIKFSVTQKRGLVATDKMEEASTQAGSFDGFQLCCEDDLVLNKYKAHLGVFWRAPERGIITNNYTVFQPRRDISSKYFEILFHTGIYQSIFRMLVYGVTEGMSPLYTNDFYSMKVIVPPIDEQLSIVVYIETESVKIDEAIELQKQQIVKLKEYKSTLINSAVTGKIRVVDEGLCSEVAM
ncbi:MAG: restriction endonuclease subunit S [Zetaproteobacteria bacterium]|nr:restriction endonuclease subunit S [Zetaproteobacteria bacterium]